VNLLLQVALLAFDTACSKSKDMKNSSARSTMGDVGSSKMEMLVDNKLGSHVGKKVSPRYKEEFNRLYHVTYDTLHTVTTLGQSECFSWAMELCSSGLELQQVYWQHLEEGRGEAAVDAAAVDSVADDDDFDGPVIVFDPQLHRQHVRQQRKASQARNEEVEVEEWTGTDEQTEDLESLEEDSFADEHGFQEYDFVIQLGSGVYSAELLCRALQDKFASQCSKAGLPTQLKVTFEEHPLKQSAKEREDSPPAEEGSLFESPVFAFSLKTQERSVQLRFITNDGDDQGGLAFVLGFQPWEVNTVSSRMPLYSSQPPQLFVEGVVYNRQQSQTMGTHKHPSVAMAMARSSVHQSNGSPNHSPSPTMVLSHMHSMRSNIHANRSMLRQRRRFQHQLMLIPEDLAAPKQRRHHHHRSHSSTAKQRVAKPTKIKKSTESMRRADAADFSGGPVVRKTRSRTFHFDVHSQSPWNHSQSRRLHSSSRPLFRQQVSDPRKESIENRFEALNTLRATQRTLTADDVFDSIGVEAASMGEGVGVDRVSLGESYGGATTRAGFHHAAI
jgi:hypothetical protein